MEHLEPVMPANLGQKATEILNILILKINPKWISEREILKN
jgi:hypothetical protein